MEKKKTTYDAIVEYITENVTMTSMDAIRLFGCTRLSHYIYLMRRDGYKISTNIRTSKNMFGQSTHYAVYRLEESNNG